MKKTAEEIIKEHPEWVTILHMGLGSASWLRYLREIDSKRQYLQVVAEFLTFLNAKRQTQADYRDTDAILDFFEFRRVETNVDGSIRFKANSIQGHVSIMNKFWCYAFARDLATEVPLVQHEAKSHNNKMNDPIQAPAFTADQLVEYYQRLPGNHTAHIGPYAVIATHGCERGVEAKQLHFEDVTSLLDSEGNHMYRIKFDRAKQLGKSATKKGNKSYNACGYIC